MMLPEIQRLFPGLRNDSEADVIGVPSLKYNCIMHTIGGRTVIIWPVEIKPISLNSSGARVFWPTDLPDDTSLENFLKFYAKFGYEVCDSESYEKGYRKIAIFCKNGTNDVTHAALMINQTMWSSKLGYSYVIKHKLRSIEGDKYGEVRCFVRRPLTITKEFDWAVLQSYIK